MVIAENGPIDIGTEPCAGEECTQCRLIVTNARFGEQQDGSWPLKVISNTALDEKAGQDGGNRD